MTIFAPRSRLRRACALAALLAAAAVGSSWHAGALARQQAEPARWAPWIEPDFPFFSSVVDAGAAGGGLPTRNLSPRALVLNLGHGFWAAVDPDLLRVAAIWHGSGVSPTALAPGSYHKPDRKTPQGQNDLPHPIGTVWLANGIYPGWQAGDAPALTDPRPPAPSPEEVGRGPIPERMGRFDAVRLVDGGVVLEYTVRGTAVREWMTLAAEGREPGVVRRVEVRPSRETLWLVLGGLSTAVDALTVSLSGSGATLETIPSGSGVIHAARIPPRERAVTFDVLISRGAVRAPAHDMPSAPPPRRWQTEVTTRISSSSARGAHDAFVVDDIALPIDNPWRRNVRPGDVQFFTDGTAAVVTLDGDVWIARGLEAPAGPVHWRRFASGLHEPLSLAIRGEQIYVFDRNGIWRLRDTNRDGEADVHELFSNAFAQTADTREFPSTIRPAPGGAFVIAKGGQEATTIGRHNGSVLRISADGKRATVLGYGFRQPNIGVNIRTGLVTASDQQGHYIPTTPLHIVRDRQFYGFLSDKLPREVYPAPIAEPLTWIPHAVNASATSQVWMFGARMGPLNDGLIHIGFNNPEIFRVLLNERGSRPQAAVVSIIRAFSFPPLHGSVNPVDGQLYLAGFQVLGWGTTSPALAGMGRVRYTGAASTIPREVVTTDRGLLLSFDVPLDRERATNPDSYTLTSWSYQRTYRYGSPQFKADGSPGIDRHAPSSAYLSEDGRRVFVAVPDFATMKRPMQVRAGWTLATADGATFQESAYFTPWELTPFDPKAEGFGDTAIDLTPRAITEEDGGPVSAAEGRKVYERFGCVACHAAADTGVSRLGPTFKGLYGSERSFLKGVVKVTADEAYLRESILDPPAKVVSGYERTGMGMPSFAGVLTDAQIESVILYIKSVK
jgi:cytochrome c2/glucose/arabinose dehydrogenase